MARWQRGCCKLLSTNRDLRFREIKEPFRLIFACNLRAGPNSAALNALSPRIVFYADAWETLEQLSKIQLSATVEKSTFKLL
jgi:hypothetical protein